MTNTEKCSIILGKYYIFLYYDIEEVKKMAYTINDDCIMCGACASECPVSCISEGDGKYIIDEDVCIDCGNCANVCPVDAPQA